ncbi:Marine sediment metagenome DNA, contig: S12H4_L00848 (Fragment) OS=marine sediment metagenome GN=S12H4_14323 PE=4 SV=1: Beta_helix [Gemmata massiliana]|uniref:Right handed beta helix domain-containing protein n=1 Tax=Gemmata massiliana TaxID=1210884 RepID=A0A6P2DLL7_9BACT
MADYYVDATGGSDANPGTSTGAAKQTLAAGIALLTAGDRLYVKAGTYTLTTTAAITAAQCGATRAGPTIIEGYVTTPGDAPETSAAPLITSSTNSVSLLTYQAGTAVAYLALRSLKISSTATTRGSGILGVTGTGSVAGNVVLEKVEIVGGAVGYNSGARLQIARARRLTIRNSVGVGVNSASIVSSALIEDCRFLDNGSHGFDIGANVLTSAQFRRCVFSGNVGSGVSFPVQGRTGVMMSIYNCTFEGNGSDGITFTFTTGNFGLFCSDCAFWGEHRVPHQFERLGWRLGPLGRVLEQRLRVQLVRAARGTDERIGRQGAHSGPVHQFRVRGLGTQRHGGRRRPVARGRNRRGGRRRDSERTVGRGFGRSRSRTHAQHMVPRGVKKWPELSRT